MIKTIIIGNIYRSFGMCMCIILPHPAGTLRWGLHLSSHWNGETDALEVPVASPEAEKWDLTREPVHWLSCLFT